MRILSLLFTAVLAGAGGAQDVDVSKGEVNGKRAMIAIPVTGVEKVTGGARYETNLATGRDPAPLPMGPAG